MAHQLTCPCGEVIADLDATFVDSVQRHLTEKHPNRDYTPDEIMFMAIPIPDRLVADRQGADPE